MNLFQHEKCKECNSNTEKIICCFLPVTLCKNEECLIMTGVFASTITILSDIFVFCGSEGFNILIYEGPYFHALIDYIKILKE